MKKFFSLLCATLLVFSASAAPVAKKAELVKKAPVAVEQMQKVQIEKAQPAMKVSLENAQIANFNQLSATPAVKVNNQKAQAPAALRNNKSVKAQIQQVSVQPAAHKAPAAVKEVIEVTDGYLYQEPDYIQFWSEAQQLYFIYYFNDYFELNKTYSDLADMYTVCTMNADYEEETATAYSITITQENELLHIDATMTMEDGTEYAITYQEVAFVPSGVQINVNATNYKAEYISYYGEYVYTASNEDFDINIWVYTDTELGTFDEDVDIDGSYLQEVGGGDYVIFHSVVTPIVVAQDEDGNKSLTGSLYAENGDEYVFNLTYEKPDAKEITLVADTLNFFTKMLSAGYYQMQGYTVDSTYEFSFYFISKSLSGNYTEEDMDAYSTWVDQKDGKKTVVSYQNLSAANIKASLVNDTLYYTGTMTLATNDGQEANITLNLSCPYKQEWGEWEDFAPFDLNTGKYTFTVLFNSPATQRDIPVQVRKDNTGFKQFKFIGWGKQIFTANGIDLIVDMGPDYVCTVPVQDIGVDVSGGVYGENAKVQDYASKTGQAVPSTYDPETGTFDLALSYFISLGSFGSAYETMVMDQPILERDTVKVNLTSIIIEEDLNSQTGTHRGWLFEGQDTDTMYIVQVLGQEKFGTFSYAAGTLGKNFYNIIPSSGQGRCQFAEGEVTITEDQEGVKLTGLLIGQDEKAYVFNWIQPAGKLNYDSDAPFDATFAWSDMSTFIDNGVISISATNADGYTIGLELYADPAATEIPAGVYTISDSQEAGTALKSLGISGGYLTECFAGTRGASGINVPCWFMVEGTITLSYDENEKLKVVVDAKNSYGQPVTALVQYEKLEPTSTVDIVSTNLSYTDEWYAQYGIQEFVLTNDNYGVLLDIFADTLVGEFTEDDVDFADSYIVDFNTGAKIPVVNTGDIVVTLDGKNLTLTASLIGADTVQYNISATGYLGYIQGDAVEGYVGEFAMENVTLLQATKSQVMINGFNEAGDTVAIVFDAKFSKTAGTIVEPQAGEYEAIMASTGFTAEYDVYPSFVGNNAGVWFIQSGKLIIAEDGSMAFLGVNSYDAPVAINFTVPVGPATDYYLVGWINNAAYGIEGDIDNFGDYHFVDGKVKATFDVMSYVQVKDNNKQIYGTDSYIAPAEMGNATLVANGPEKIGINGGVEYEYTLVVNEDGTLTLSYEVVTVGLRNAKANMKAAKQIKNGQIVIVRENKEYNILGAAL